MRGYVGDLQEDERYLSEELINLTKCSDRGCVYKNNWCVNYNSIRGVMDTTLWILIILG